MIVQPRGKRSPAIRSAGRAAARLGGLLVVLPALLVPGCFSSADRDNPLDPDSSLFEEIGTVTGTVTTRFQPFQAIAGARVQLLPAGRSTTTDAAGAFSFPDTPPGTYSIVAEADGFAPDTVGVVLETNTGATVHVPLNGLPFFRTRRAYSIHVSRWWPPDDLYAATLAVEVDDPDGAADIARVAYDIPDLALQDSLAGGIDSGRFETIIEATDLPGGSLHELVGHDIFFDATDDSGATARSEPVSVARVIEQTPVTISPQGLETVGPQPDLRWQTMALPYPHTYTVEVFRIIAGISTLVWRREQIPSEQGSLAVTDSLSTGDHFWTLTAVDEFGDTSRSREASFRVE
jgi:hypothetical protein